ncbi:hypothetical protein BP5796_02728 [Coleophoma crateriformis]|uniref:Uncharacterized protein n=1 Tax=Coleophoma crateriformis TaxID=565419 RepID=A0A3D8SZ11_9HELO|nr:hypothetical protein BP5796_02728 [Coleophoma crateriformis]
MRVLRREERTGCPVLLSLWSAEKDHRSKKQNIQHSKLEPLIQGVVYRYRTIEIHPFHELLISAITVRIPRKEDYVVTLDLASFDSIRHAAAEINARVAKLDVLINNAGIMGLEKYTLTRDGLEAQFGANHIGHFLFTNLIMPKIIAAGPGARVVNLSSNGHWLGDWRGEDYNFHDGQAYDPWAAYGQSKTASILFAKSLVAKLGAKGVLAYSLHPGMIQTNLGNDVDLGVWPGVFAMFAARGYPVDENLTRFKTLPQGVATTLTAALSPEIVKHSGAYLVDCNISGNVARHATDMDRAEALWKESEKIVGESFAY